MKWDTTLERRIRELCAQAVAAKDDGELQAAVSELRDALREHSGRLERLLSQYPFLRSDTAKPATVTLPGMVERVIKSADPNEPDKAQIAVEKADELYREIRIDNTLQNDKGEEVALKPGAAVAVTVEAPADATTPQGNATGGK
jgi:glutathione S-transferase